MCRSKRGCMFLGAWLRLRTFLEENEMKKKMKQFVGILLVLATFISTIPMQVFALSAKEQEDIYRVNTWWKDEFNQQYIDWLLNDDNFVYHLDVTEGSVIHDMSYNSLNLEPVERKRNYVEILTSFIGLSYTEVREQSASEAYATITIEFLSGFNKHLKETEFFAVDEFVQVEKAINAVSKEYLSNYYGIDTNVGKYSYSEIYERIQYAFDNNTQDFDWVDRKSAVYDTFFSYIDSSDWLERLGKVSNVFSLVGNATNVCKDTLAIIAEAESYAIADEKLVELLKYIRSKTTDSALNAACDEIIAKFGNSYEANIANGLLEYVGGEIHDWGSGEFVDALWDLCGIYGIFAKIGITAGNTVSDQWFNTSDTKKHMQSVYCVNIISTLMSELLEQELANDNLYASKSQFSAEYAEDIIYHMQVLIASRKLGEKNYYNLKNSVYSSAIINVFNTFNWGSFASEAGTIDAWYTEFINVINAVEASLYKMISVEYYYEKQEETSEDEFVYENQKLVSYNGLTRDLYLPINDSYSTIASKAFDEITTVELVNIPFHIETIETYAFYNCYNLKSITIDSSTVVINDNAFYGCSDDLVIYGYDNSTAQKYAEENGITFVSLDSDWINNQIVNYDDFVIEDGVLINYLGDSEYIYIPNGVKEIGENVFSKFGVINTIVIPNSVTSIGSNAFEGCDIENIELYDSITNIAYNAFYNANIEQVYIGEGSIKVTDSMLPPIMFNNIYLPSSVTEIETFGIYYSQIGETLSRLCLGRSVSWACHREVSQNIFVDESNNSFSSVDGILYNKAQTSLLLCPSLKENVTSIPSSVTSIRELAFSDCIISKVQLPNSINSIGKYSFHFSSVTELIYDCNVPVDAWGESKDWGDSYYIPFEDCLIEKLIIGESVLVVPNFAFSGVSISEEINLGTKVTHIGNRAFAYCNVNSICIPDSVLYLGFQAFSDSNIQNVEYNATCADCAGNVFGGSNVSTVVFGENVEKIPYALFSGCSTLETVILSNNLQEIGDYAFEYCESLKAIELPQSVSKIGLYAFSGCKSLKSITIPENVTSIDGWIFYDCSNLTQVTYEAKHAATTYYSFASDTITEFIIGKNVEYLDFYFFQGLTNIKRLVWNAIDAESRFLNLCYSDEQSVETSIDTLVIGEDVERIYYGYAGLGNTSLISITSVEYNAKNCTEWDWAHDLFLPNVSKITIGSKVESLPDAFMCGTPVASVVIPDNVKKIGSQCLSSCSNLEEVTVLNKGENFQMSWGCFSGCPNLTIYGYSSNDSLVYHCETSNIPFIPLCQHSSTEIKNLQISTCTQDGYTGDTCCVNCGKILDVGYFVEALGHKYESIVTAPTCTENGYTTYTCSGCGDTYIADETEPIGHQFVGGICTGCNERTLAVREMSSQIRFTKNTDGSFANRFDVRTRAKITDEDFASFIASTNGEAEQKISSVGFVYKANATDFSLELARKSAQGENVEGYKNKPISYIQDADGYYMFTCLITDIPVEDKEQSLTAYAYICVDNQWYFFDEAVTIEFSELYDTYYPLAAEKNGWSL